MNIIDFHAHIYPEKIADKASKAIGAFYDAPMAYNGSVQNLIASGEKIGVTKYVVHSAATGAGQVESINKFIIGEVKKESRFIGYGTMHPDYEKFENEILRMKYEGNLRGIKLHPDFQKFQIDADAMDPIYNVLAHEKMPVLVHAGDCRYDFSGPARIAHVIEKHPDLTIIAAHFGGYTEWENSFKYLCGENVYFDTSSTLWKLPVDEANKMIKKHGVEKFFWGSDYPMWDHKGELEKFYKLDLNDEEREKILWKNAAELLGLDLN